jgi:hypothetical protein
MTVAPTNPLTLGQNSELYVNVGPPGTPSPLIIGDPLNRPTHPEFLYLVNGVDDNKNGWIDEGWDGVDNNGIGGVDELAEWEQEQWQGVYGNQVAGQLSYSYTIQRRPAPVANAREVALPSNVVIDLTTWNTTLERSRLPVSPFTGYADIIVNPDGSVVPTTVYSSPSSLGMGGSFFHFWLAERGDLAAPDMTKPNAGTSWNTPPYLPLPLGLATGYFGGNTEIKGDYRLITLFTRTGQLLTNEIMPFDTPAAAAARNNLPPYNQSAPFLEAQQGVQGSDQ